MKKILFTLLFAVSTFAFAQMKSDKPVYLVEGIIASQQFVNQEVKNITRTDVFKNTAKIPADLAAFTNYADHGLVNVKVKNLYYDVLPLSTLNRQHDLALDTPIYFDGHLFTNTDTKILGNVLGDIEIKEINGQRMIVMSSLK